MSTRRDDADDVQRTVSCLFEAPRRIMPRGKDRHTVASPFEGDGRINDEPLGTACKARRRSGGPSAIARERPKAGGNERKRRRATHQCRGPGE